LTERSRVVALDARGHGRSERRPVDVSRAAHAADAVFVVERLNLAPTVVVGHSLGGQVAMLVAAERPNLVCGLVVVDGSPDCGEGAEVIEDNVADLGRALRGWPVPFPSREAALAFFGGPLSGASRVAGLAQVKWQSCSAAERRAVRGSARGTARGCRSAPAGGSAGDFP
jgi:pimeloyl-ACP methyl ester carboxylesterase